MLRLFLPVECRLAHNVGWSVCVPSASGAWQVFLPFVRQYTQWFRFVIVAVKSLAVIIFIGNTKVKSKHSIKYTSILWCGCVCTLLGFISVTKIVLRHDEESCLWYLFTSSYFPGNVLLSHVLSVFIHFTCQQMPFLVVVLRHFSDRLLTIIFDFHERNRRYACLRFVCSLSA